jgi:signal peptidase I
MDITPKPEEQDAKAATADAGTDEPSLIGSIGRFALELVEIVVISLAIILPIRYFLIQPFYVKGASMEPTFDDHEYLIIDELSYRFRAPSRGEVVVFRYPLDPRQYFIKRVVGLPGETVRVSDDAVVIVNAEHPEGFALDESGYLSPDTITRGERTVDLGPGEYFVLGDNRGASLDSRTFGSLPLKNIVGRVWIRGWPLDRVAVFPAP